MGGGCGLKGQDAVEAINQARHCQPDNAHSPSAHGFVFRFFVHHNVQLVYRLMIRAFCLSFTKVSTVRVEHDCF